MFLIDDEQRSFTLVSVMSRARWSPQADHLTPLTISAEGCSDPNSLHLEGCSVNAVAYSGCVGRGREVVVDVDIGLLRCLAVAAHKKT